VSAVDSEMICSRSGAAGFTTSPSPFVQDSISDRSIFSPSFAIA
jgi:hypothetical protein